LFHEEESEEEVVGMVVRMEYFVYLPDVGMEHLVDVAIEEEEEEAEGNHLRKEHVL
jgi:hypothetical protein